MTLQFSEAQQHFLQLQQTIDRERITQLVESHQQGKLRAEDKSYYEDLISQFVALVKLPNTAHLAMQLLPEFKMTVPVLLDGMAYRALQDQDAKACVFACYMIDQSLLERDLTPLFNVVIEQGTPELWVELVKKVNHAPAERIVEKVYQCDKSVQDFWESQIL
ncbi:MULTISPECIES: hypothetical protein [unclassified Moraxella]|uniref:hypothetical protein n=1 Tax=unclassified Moraxella TaxID=2685852 RepID=UPI003AF5BD20